MEDIIFPSLCAVAGFLIGWILSKAWRDASQEPW